MELIFFIYFFKMGSGKKEIRKVKFVYVITIYIYGYDPSVSLQYVLPILLEILQKLGVSTTGIQYSIQATGLILSFIVKPEQITDVRTYFGQTGFVTTPLGLVPGLAELVTFLAPPGLTVPLVDYYIQPQLLFRFNEIPDSCFQEGLVATLSAFAPLEIFSIVGKLGVATFLSSETPSDPEYLLQRISPLLQQHTNDKLRSSKNLPPVGKFF